MIKTSGKQRNFLIDHVKLLASYFVVFIHCVFPGDFGIAVKAIARFAVPFFFLCSGYFMYGDTSARICKKMRHIMGLFLVTSVLYIFADVGAFVLSRDLSGIYNYLHRYRRSEVLWEFVLFNVPVACSHLWYLLGMIYVYGIYWLFEKYKPSDRFIGISAVVLLALHLILWHGLITFKITDQTFYVRNFLFVGYPFVSQGFLLRKYQHKIPKLKGSTVLLLVGAGCICSVMSRFAFGNKSLPFGAILISVVLMLVCITAPQPEKPVIRDAGKYSTYIYLFHPLIQRGYLAWFAAETANRLFLDFAPVFVCILSTVFAVLCTCVHRIIPNVYRKTRANGNA